MTEILRSEDFRDVRKPLEQASWLPRHVYFDPAVYALELERIFKREWLFAAHVSAVSKPGDFTTLTLFDQPLLIVRGKDGGIRCFYNVCKHRAMAIAQGSGHGEGFVCPYHAWSYDTEGQLINAPSMEHTAGFDPCKVKLREVRSEIVNGMLFINFDDAATALAPRIADLIEIISPWNIAGMEPVYQSEISGEWNWKVMLENANENYHTIAVHRESYHGISPAERSYSTDNQGRAWTDLHTPYLEPGAMTSAPKLPNVPKWAGERQSFFALHPQFLMSVGEDNVSIYVTHIDGPGKTRFLWTMYMAKGAKQWAGFDAYIAKIGAWIDRINGEDRIVCIGTQKGLKSDGWSPPRYSHLEKAPWQFHQWYLDRMIGRSPELQRVVNR